MKKCHKGPRSGGMRPYDKGTEAKKPMNHYLAAALLMVAAIGFPMLCAAMGMKVNTRNDWWD
jgi:hypothetical protein